MGWKRWIQKKILDITFMVVSPEVTAEWFNEGAAALERIHQESHQYDSADAGCACPVCQNLNHEHEKRVENEWVQRRIIN